MVQRTIRKKTAPAVVVRELKTKEAWLEMYSLIKQLNKQMGPKQFEALLIEMLARGYRCVGAYQGKKLVGAAGFWIGYRFWCRKYIDIDNVVVDEKHRAKGIGKKMMVWIEREGRKRGCESAMLDCYTTHHQSHRFYFREGYTIIGYHFIKDL
jgi:diamine N-acetyltransferase